MTPGVTGGGEGSFLEQVAAASYKIALQDGEPKTLDFKIGGTP